MKKALLVLFLMVMGGAPSQAASALSCTDSNANVSSTSPVVVIGNCAIAAGAAGVVIATAQAETTCGTTATEGVQLLIGTTQPTNGLAPPGGMAAMTPVQHQNGCNSSTLVTGISGSYVGTPGALYWVTVVVSTSTAVQAVTWNNQTIKILTF